MASPSSFLTACSWLALLIVLVHCRPSVFSSNGKEDVSWWLDESESEPTKNQRNTLDSISRRWQQNEPDALKRVYLKNSTVTCNDGTPAGYYIRKYPGSKIWLLYLEGGWYCFDTASCESRWITTSSLMSSKFWQEYHMASGILSGNPEENPIFWKANVVFLPYCSSDVWTGTAAKVKGQRFSFMGSLILKEIVKTLLPRGLMKARKVMLTGSSAGGTGVLLNADNVAEQLHKTGSKAIVKGLVDSGWFLDSEPFSSSDCIDPRRCSPVAGLKKGMKMWKSELGFRCRDELQQESWKCFFGSYIHASLQTPVFIAQYLYDEVQLMAGNVFVPRTKAQGLHVQRIRRDLSSSLQNVSAVFAPACVGHVLLRDKNWTKFSVNGVTFASALRCWWNSNSEVNRYSSTKSLRSLTDEDSLMLSDDATVVKCDMAKLRRCRRRLRSQRTSKKPHQRPRRCRCKGDILRKKLLEVPTSVVRTKRQASSGHLHLQHQWTSHMDRCSHHLIEECQLPNCNEQCPKSFDNFSGKPIDFEQMLRNAGVKSHSPIREIFSR